MPPYTTSIIQPVDLWVVRTFKAFYTRITLNNLVKPMDRGDNLSQRENPTITNCIQIIKIALMEMRSETISALWKSMWPGEVNGARIYP